MYKNLNNTKVKNKRIKSDAAAENNRVLSCILIC